MPDQVSIGQVLAGSPASAAGLRQGDEVVSINGEQIGSVKMWDQWKQYLKPGEEGRLQVNRAGTELILVSRGVEPEREAVLYYHWQLAFAGVSTAFAILLAFSGPLRRPHSLWRPIALVLCGLVATAALLAADWQNGVVLLKARWPVDNRPYPLAQVSVCLCVSVALTALATWEIVRIIASCERSKPPSA